VRCYFPQKFSKAQRAKREGVVSEVVVADAEVVALASAGRSDSEVARARRAARPIRVLRIMLYSKFDDETYSQAACRSATPLVRALLAMAVIKPR